MPGLAFAVSHEGDARRSEVNGKMDRLSARQIHMTLVGMGMLVIPIYLAVAAVALCCCAALGLLLCYVD